MRILVVEDNPKIADAVGAGLKTAGFDVETANSGAGALERAAAGGIDLYVLDRLLPDGDSVDICRTLRGRGVGAKILMLTALQATSDKVGGLDAGADDYLTKPFDFNELLARVRALLRSDDSPEDHCLRCEDMELDLFTRQVRRGGDTIELSNREFGVLECLLRNQGRVLSRSQIGERVWDLNFEAASNLVDVYISSLRKKVDRGRTPELIHTSKGVGYWLGINDEAG